MPTGMASMTEKGLDQLYREKEELGCKGLSGSKA